MVAEAGRPMIRCSGSRLLTTPEWSGRSSMYATSFLANQNQRGRTCQHCMETDHASLSCALAPPSTGRNLVDSRPRQAQRGQSDRRRRDPASCVKMACFDWNDGRCSSPYCRFKHVCATCGVATHTDQKCTGAKPADPSKEYLFIVNLVGACMLLIISC